MLMQARAVRAADTHRPPRGRDGEAGRISGASSRLSAVACLMMLERVNYLASSGVPLPRAEAIDQLTAIVVAAFQAPQRPA